MASTTYTATVKASIYKTKSAKTVVTTIAKGKTIKVSNSSNGMLQLASDHSKINNKTVKGCWVKAKSFKKKSSSSTKKDTSTVHKSHVNMNSITGKATIQAYVRTKCSGGKTSGVFIKRGAKVKILKQCPTNGMLYVQAKLSNGNQSKVWVGMTAIQMNSSSANTRLQQLKNKLKNSGKKGKAKLNALKNAIKNSQIAHKENQKNSILNDLYSLAKVSKINTKEYANKLLIQNSQGIHGMPYQFMPSVDYRITNDVSFGRKYVERIVMKMPLVLFTPGRPDFMATFNKQEKKNIVQALITSAIGKNSMKSMLNKIVKHDGRYYSFYPEYRGYYQYVNRMLRYCAIMMGIGDVLHCTQGFQQSNEYGHSFWGKLFGTAKPSSKKKQKFKNLNWSNMTNSNLQGFLGSPEYVAFYVDSETSISESFDNSTTESSIAGSVNNASQLSREIQFLAGPVAGVDLGNITDAAGYDKAKDEVNDIANTYFKGSPLLKRIGEMFQTIKRGGRIIFPELWGSSDYNKQYNLSIKLRTPDGDKISWYLNILVPIIHILGLAAPHSMGANGFSSPYLVRAFYKGIFNCDMGLITNVDIAKGKESAWTTDGLPTEVDVSITLKDLYTFFAISGGREHNNDKRAGITKDYKFFTNTALLDYLCNSCGININKVEVARQLTAYATFVGNSAKDIFPNIWESFLQGLNASHFNVYKAIVKPGGSF